MRWKVTIYCETSEHLSEWGGCKIWVLVKTHLDRNFRCVCVFERADKQGDAGAQKIVVMVLPAVICNVNMYDRRYIMLRPTEINAKIKD